MERKLLLGLLGLILLITAGCGTDKKDAQHPIGDKTTFRQLSSVLKASCVDCHNGGNAKAGLDLTSVDSAKAKLGPGDLSQANTLWNRVGIKKDMAPANSGYTISAEGIELIRKWIVEGAQP